MNYDTLINLLKERPAPYTPGTPRFWDDPYISKRMLEAHLDPETDAASRKPDFIDRSARWIRGLLPDQHSPALLDLGCGPGLYAERFTQAGTAVTGIDFSPNSISYAAAQAAGKGLSINYICGNYLDVPFPGPFDAVTLIYCDFGVLCPGDRSQLLRKIRQALKPGGLFITDVCSLRQYENRPETAHWSYCDGGFWSSSPYACLHAFLRYDDEATYADRYVVVEKDRVRCFNIWNHRFTTSELEEDLKAAGFSGAEFFDTVAGDPFTDGRETICAVARR